MCVYIHCLRVADLWQASGPAEAASELMCFMSPSFLIPCAYTLPAGLQVLGVFSEVMAAAEVALLATFGNALGTIRSQALLKEFLSLPQPALLALVRSRDYKTDMEESVPLLLTCWCGQSVGKPCSQEELNALHQPIQYSRLSQPFLSCMFDKLLLPKLSCAQLMGLWEFSTLLSEEWEDQTTMVIVVGCDETMHSLCSMPRLSLESSRKGCLMVLSGMTFSLVAAQTQA